MDQDDNDSSRRPSPPSTPRTPRSPADRWRAFEPRRGATRILFYLRGFAGMVAVYEDEPDGKSTRAPALVFESADFSVRLEQYPDNWQRLTDEQLGALCG